MASKTTKSVKTAKVAPETVKGVNLIVPPNTLVEVDITSGADKVARRYLNYIISYGAPDMLNYWDVFSQFIYLVAQLNEEEAKIMDTIYELTLGQASRAEDRYLFLQEAITVLSDIRPERQLIRPSLDAYLIWTRCLGHTEAENALRMKFINGRLIKVDDEIKDCAKATLEFFGRGREPFNMNENVQREVAEEMKKAGWDAKACSAYMASAYQALITTPTAILPIPKIDAPKYDLVGNCGAEAIDKFNGVEKSALYLELNLNHRLFPNANARKAKKAADKADE
jgi:hypothetical protein